VLTATQEVGEFIKALAGTQPVYLEALKEIGIPGKPFFSTEFCKRKSRTMLIGVDGQAAAVYSDAQQIAEAQEARAESAAASKAPVESAAETPAEVLAVPEKPKIPEAPAVVPAESASQAPESAAGTVPSVVKEQEGEEGEEGEEGAASAAGLKSSGEETTPPPVVITPPPGSPLTPSQKPAAEPESDEELFW